MKKLPDHFGIFNPREQVEGWDKIAAEESELRNDAMLGFDEDICGLQVKPLTFRHVLWLDVYQNVFLSGLKPEELLQIEGIHLHIARFMWVMSPSFSPFSRVKRWLYFRRYKKASHNIKVNEIVSAIQRFMDDSTFDLRTDSRSTGKSYYSSAAAVVHALCSIYSGLSPFPKSKNAAIDLPLKIAGQLLRVQIRSNNPRAVLNNRTDDLEAKELEELNREFKQN